jgi:hypothetical protein
MELGMLSRNCLKIGLSAFILGMPVAASARPPEGTSGAKCERFCSAPIGPEVARLRPTFTTLIRARTAQT